MDSKIVKIACLGCGRHMKKTLAPILSTMNTIDVVVCVDVNIDRAIEIASTLNAKYTGDYKEIERYSIDAAVTALTPDTNKEIIDFLMQRGIPIYIEKPVASSSNECEIIELNHHNKMYPIQVGFNFRFSESIKTFKTRI